MSDEEKQNINEEKHGCNENHLEDSEVDNTTIHSDNTTRTSSEIADYNEQLPAAEGSEIMPNDVIVIEDVSRESKESSIENPDYNVLYEFPIDCESKNVSHLSQPCASHTNSTLSEKILQISNKSKCFSDFKINKNPDDKLIEVFDTKSPNKETPSFTNTANISNESERKRKKFPISLMQNKRHKEAENPCKQLIQPTCQTKNSEQIKCLECSSDEFADAEGSITDSSFSVIDEPNSTSKTEEQLPLKDLTSNFQKSKENVAQSYIGENSFKLNAISSDDLNSSENSQPVDKNGEKAFFTSLKGDTTPVIKLSSESKKKFELSMATILEVSESESDEQIYQPLQSKTNPLKMKTTVGKRKDKCNVCNVRLGLCAIKCRCGGYYCAKHRYDKEHNCSFDYKSMGAAEIRKNNPRIVAEKVRKL